jgi:hypothetical protein
LPDEIAPAVTIPIDGIAAVAFHDAADRQRSHVGAGQP